MRLVAIILFTYETRTDLFGDLSEKNIGKHRCCTKFIWLEQKKKLFTRQIGCVGRYTQQNKSIILLAVTVLS